MMKKQTNSNRGERIASTVQRFVAEILRDDYGEDETLSRVSVVGAESSGGLQFARIWYYFRGVNGDGFDAAVQKRLDALTPTIRHELARRMNQKFVPNIKFVYDATLETGERIEELLENIEL
ncbi:MAG: 30S ribosome-binding factor RbfA [Alphaproteobacteria bacterium]|nr:30S ribosome-binding factor RbfA [Alphaproteobacteria bacterium]